MPNCTTTQKTLINGPTVENGPYLKNIKLGQLALQSALGRNKIKAFQRHLEEEIAV